MNNFARTEKSWLLRQPPKDITKQQIHELALDVGIHEKLVEILALRGITTLEEIRNFLTPFLRQLPSPFLMKGMAEAVGILVEALKSGKPVTVYGDFDADGVTSTAVISTFFSELKIPLKFYIPDRLKEGYGLNIEAVKKIFEENKLQWGEPGVLITADCGISDVDAAETAKQLGFILIITDHHKPPELLPRADAILNPLQPGCDFPCKNLAGVGVAFYLICGLRSGLMEKGHWQDGKAPNLKSYMDITAIGTVADQVPLTVCNRIIVKAGLEVLNLSKRVGVRMLLNNTRNNESEITSEDIAFQIAPRINAVGRIGSARKAVQLLNTSSVEEAKKLALELEEANRTRKNIETDIFAEADKMIPPQALEMINSLVLYKKDWHQGVLGIVASRLVEKYNRPVILLTDCKPEAHSMMMKKLVKGSGRSVDGIDIHNAVASCRKLLERFGGHEGAVGLTLPKDNIETFRQLFEQLISDEINKTLRTSYLFIDAETSLEEIAEKKFFNSYSLLAPFGTGNPEPVFSMHGRKLHNPRLVGSNHLRFSIEENGRCMNGIGFGLGDFLEEAQKSLLDIAFKLKRNSYLGQNNWEMYTVALRPSQQ